MDDGDNPYDSWVMAARMVRMVTTSTYHKVPPNHQSTTVEGPTKGLGAADKWMMGDGLVAPGTLTHRLQRRTTCKIQMANWVWEGVYP